MTDTSATTPELVQHSLNPFKVGSSQSLTEMIIACMDDLETDGASALISGVMAALWWLHQQNTIALSLSEIRTHLALEKVIDLTRHYPDMPGDIRARLHDYLASLPEFDLNLLHDQPQTTRECHDDLVGQHIAIMDAINDPRGRETNLSQEKSA